MTEMRNVLIVGGSGGVGSGIARRCAAVGSWPLVGYAGHAELAQRVVEQCGRGASLHLDLLQPDLPGLAGLRRLDAVVFAAGMYLPGARLLDTSDENLRRLIDVNMLAPIRLTRALLKAGHPLRDVLVVLSTASFGRGSGPYALSKIGELAVCKLLVRELADRGIRLNAIAPGWIETPMAALAAAAGGGTLDAVRAKHLDARILTAEEIGGLCAAILSDTASNSTGRLAVWDRRAAREPVWLTLETVFSADQLAWTMPAAAAGKGTSSG
jgi:NAD(P)-dependent dehydrogenase (short-subunit alcohol dehydrogenase family)